MAQAYQEDFLESISTTPRAGQIAENTQDSVRSGVVAEVSIPPGLLVVPGTTDTQTKLPASAAEVLKALGVSVLLELGYELTDAFGIGRAVSYLEEGEIWVAVEGAVTRGAQPFVRFADGTGATAAFTQKGAFRADADTNTSAGVLPGCRFSSSTTGAGFAKVRLNLPATG